MVSKVTFGAFSVICFVSAAGVCFGDIGAKAEIPYFRLQAVLGFILAGAYLLRECLSIKLGPRIERPTARPDSTPRDWMGNPRDRE